MSQVSFFSPSVNIFTSLIFSMDFSKQFPKKCQNEKKKAYPVAHHKEKNAYGIFTFIQWRKKKMLLLSI